MVSHFTLHCQRPPYFNPGIFKYFMVQSQGWGRRLQQSTITVVSRTPLVEPCWLPKYYDSQTDRPGKTEKSQRNHSSPVRNPLAASIHTHRKRLMGLIVAVAVSCSDIHFTWSSCGSEPFWLVTLERRNNLSLTNEKLSLKAKKCTIVLFNALLLLQPHLGRPIAYSC